MKKIFSSLLICLGVSCASDVQKQGVGEKEEDCAIFRNWNQLMKAAEAKGTSSSGESNASQVVGGSRVTPTDECPLEACFNEILLRNEKTKTGAKL